MNPVKSKDRHIYLGFLILIAWLPLPLGSNRPWAEAIMEIWVFTLMFLWLIAFMRYQVQTSDAYKKAAPVIGLFLLWLVWILLQIIPLPPVWVASFSPAAFDHHSLVNSSDLMTLSLDSHATAAGWFKSLAYVLIFILSLLLIHSRRRLRQLAYVVIYSGLFQAVYGSLMTLSGLGYGFFIQNPLALNVTTGTFINRNHFAGYLVMALSVGIGMMIASLDTESDYTAKQRLRYYLKLILSTKLRLRLYLVMMVIALVLTHSRMGNTSFFASLMIAGGLGLILS
ncbi:MAG: O-antigen ligase family protein, partial [Gammaproteobacteria bacterium]